MSLAIVRANPSAKISVNNMGLSMIHHQAILIARLAQLSIVVIVTNATPIDA